MTLKVQVERVRTDASLRSYLNPEMAGVVTDGKIQISGWAHSTLGPVDHVLIKSQETIFKTPLGVVRDDVEKHLAREGLHGIQQPLGYRFDFLFTNGMEVGYEINGQQTFYYKIYARDLVAFDEYKDLPALLAAEEGVCGNFYFHNGPDWSKVIVMFNGALTPGKVAAEKAIFQRWSWAKHFKHPVVIMADPVTTQKNPIYLGWYLGRHAPNELPDTIRPLLEALRQKSPHSKLISFGSSGGGFAAIGGALLGLFDTAIAINPQIDAVKFDNQRAVDDFLKFRRGDATGSDLKSYGFDHLAAGREIIYIQNRSDLHHFEVHYTPFKTLYQSSPAGDQITFIEYEDAKAGHMPPVLKDLTAIAGTHMSDLLKAE